MPKNQSTAAQTARRETQSGGKYTEALRRATTCAAPGAPHVLRFLAERSRRGVVNLLEPVVA
ncbi:hypothetical protein [Streptomyces sp. H27-C3]|uniref:hypothetical protein n=1 Tax=Streptomyces sp. H27-C3 TaxID=3046305 RepID=UPI0024B8BC34|nr:hypothetical protein [Streptomyces sp. H27-C3]MDJ0466978.1 hypothetical protein [Streptomyces sp. H27-C3]